MRNPLSLVKIVAFAGLSAGVALGTAAGQTTLPSGHPDISKMQGKAGGDLPAGHPDISKLQGAGAKPGLPAGHPSLDQLAGATTQPTGPGKLTIHTVQGTKGGPAISGDQVFVEVYGETGKVLKSIETKLDAKGQTEVEIPLTVLCQPVVHIVHAGVGYEGVCKVMDRQRRGQNVEMTIYEATDKQPDITMGMRHVIVQVAPEGLRITEMLAIANPSDKTWVGMDSGGKRTTLSIPLAAGARDLQIINAPDDAIEIRDGKLVGNVPIMPGQAEFQVQYLVPVTDGKADLTITAPAPLGRMFVFIPDDGSNVTTSGLESLGIRKTGDGNKRGYQASSLKAGQEVKLSFSGLKLPTEPVKKGDATPPAGPASSSHLPQIAAGVGGAVILGGATVLLAKSPKKSADRG